MKLSRNDLDYIVACWATGIAESCLNGVEWGLGGKRHILPRNDGKFDEKWIKNFLDMKFTHEEEEVMEIGTSRDEVHIGTFAKKCLAQFEKEKNQTKGVSDINYAYTDHRAAYDEMIKSLKALTKSKTIHKARYE